jgi:hypothetical protein
VQLAQVLGRTLLGDLVRAKPQAGEGRVLSFVPTLSTGMSPALERVTEQVHTTFLLKESPKEALLWD